MAEDIDEQSLAFTASGYQTVVTVYTSPAPGVRLVLKADPRRWFLKFDRGSTVLVDSPLLPAPYPQGITTPVNQDFPIEFKWRDCPSVVSGEWYGSFGAGTELIITQCLYVG